jgi:Xaa-Pro aminopeptidase
MFSKETYGARRNILKGKLGTGVILLLGNDESPMNYADNCYRFRQDSSFLYFFGLNQPGLAAVIDLDEDREIIFGDELTIDDIVWMGHQPTVAERARQIGVDETRPVSELGKYLETAAGAGRPVHFLPPYRPENKLWLSDLLAVPPDQADMRASLELIQAVVALRSVKTPEEIFEIEKAVDTSVDMHLAAMTMARPGMSEAEIAAEVEKIALAGGGSVSFPVIATVHGETLHNHFHGNTLQAGDLFLLDAGAETDLGYAGDLSSTFPVDTRFTSRQKTIYDIALAAYQAAVDTIAPGVRNLEVHLAAARTIAAGMKDLGLMKGNLEDAVTAGAHAMFFPCGVGHMMGLDVHDMEDLGEVHVGYGGRPKSTLFGLKSLRLARNLEPGFVLTVEPGIYFIPQLMDLWRSQNRFREFLDYDAMDKWRDFGGVRNEENYLVTADGKRRLGKKKPLTTDEVQAFRAG